MEEEINKLKEKIAEKEKEIAKLKKANEEIINQLEIVLNTWTFLMHGIESDLGRGTPLFYATRNKLAEWRNKLSK